VKVLKRAFGEYQTNCYILDFENFQFVVDPGVGAFQWVKREVKDLKGILLTHAHFDHMWDSYKIAEEFGVKIYLHKLDEVILKNDFFGRGVPKYREDLVELTDFSLSLSSIPILFHHLPGHTPGSSILEIENIYFSGDVLFKGSIGRFDFPFSSRDDMRRSLEKVLKLQNFPVFPGHGENTFLELEKNSLRNFIYGLST
jgi:glyoxylase-like metal-dependent hydrolase (beta-lactamase superfamily II)